MRRMNSRSLPLLTEEGNKFKQLNHLRTLEPGAYGEWAARMVSEGKEYSVRVCVYRKTDEQRLESERKYFMTAKRKQRKPEPEALEMAGYVVVVTILQELNPVSVLTSLAERACFQTDEIIAWCGASKEIYDHPRFCNTDF